MRMRAAMGPEVEIMRIVIIRLEDMNEHVCKMIGFPGRIIDE